MNIQVIELLLTPGREVSKSNEEKVLKRLLLSDDQQDEKPEIDAGDKGVTRDCIDDGDNLKRREMFVSKYGSMKHTSPISNVCLIGQYL